MSDITGISGSSDPYVGSTYSATSNDRNTLDISDYFTLLAAQLANQDMTSPMSNSEMMAQMTQMAMVQSITSMNEAMETSQAVTTQTYAASLIGQEVTVAVTDENGVATGVKYGTVASVNLTQSPPVIMLEGSSTEYPLTYVLGLGNIADPYNTTETPEDGETDGPGDVTEPGETEEPGSTEGSDGTEEPGTTEGSDGTEEPGAED